MFPTAKRSKGRYCISELFTLKRVRNESKLTYCTLTGGIYKVKWGRDHKGIRMNRAKWDDVRTLTGDI